jgi:hypothetical protein
MGFECARLRCEWMDRDLRDLDLDFHQRFPAKWYDCQDWM